MSGVQHPRGRALTRVFHFLPLRWGLEDIQKQRFKVARIKDLNDPFEMMSARAGDRRLREGLISARNVAHDQIGFLCFSRDLTNPVQWSHYADGHKGVCLGVELPGHLLEPVRYSNRRLEMREADFMGGNPRSHAKITTALFTKFEHWQYEKELRAVIDLSDPALIHEDGHIFQPVDGVTRLASVIVGAQCPIGRNALQQLLGNNLLGVELTKARLAFNTFNVVEQRDARLWE